MVIGWAHSDGTSGVYDNASEAAMSDFRYTDQQRLEESFNALKGTPGQAPPLGTPGQAPPLGEPGQSPPLGEPGQRQELRTNEGYGESRGADWYPTKVDVGISQGNDLSYGSNVAPFLKEGAGMRTMPSRDVINKFNEATGGPNPVDLSKAKYKPIDEEHAIELHRAWLATNRSAVAALGFDPRVVVSSNDPSKYTLKGFQERLLDTEGKVIADQIWIDRKEHPELVHEAIHRGLKLLKEQTGSKFLHSDEILTRALMQKHFGDIEQDLTDNQTLNLISKVSPATLDYIEKKSSELIAKQRGKRAASLEEGQEQEQSNYQKFAEYVHDLRVKFMGEPEKWSTKEHMGMFLDQAMSVMGAGYRMPKGPIPGLKTVNWPEGWGTKAAEGPRPATADYPHVQQAFKEAMESGATTIPQIIDHMTLNGTPTTTGIVQSLRKKAGLEQAPAERWSAEKNDKFMELVKSGKTDREISEAMGITRNSVIGKISRLQEADPSFERTVSPASKSTMVDKVDRIRELAEKGMVANDIGKELGHTGAYIRTLSSAAGIELPRDPRSPGGGGRKNPDKSESKWYQYLKRRLELKD